MSLKRYLIALSIVLYSICAFGQSPYHLDLKKEIGLYGLGLGTLVLGNYYQGKTASLTLDEINILDVDNLNSLDRIATDYLSLNAHNASNYFWYGSFALPFSTLAFEKTRPNFGKIMLLYGESIFITSGITTLTKFTFKRSRPFTYNSEAAFARKTEVTARTSFISGHTSMTAANCFFVAKIFNDYYPDSKFKYLIWGTAAVVPAITGYLRVRAGRHFPTDVGAGYLVGAATGILVPHFHKKKLIKNEDMSLNLNFPVSSFSWKF